MKYIFTNFGAGNGPFIRTIDMGIELINLLEEKLNEKISILVPWVYGKRQKRIIYEEYGELLKLHPNKILLDENLGQLFRKVLYDGRHYDLVLKELISSYDNNEKSIQTYLQKGLLTKNLKGELVKINGKDIIIEVSRNPPVATNIKYSYYTSIGYFEKIIHKAIEDPEINLNKKLLQSVLPIAKRIESYHQLYFQPTPNCFSYEKDRKPYKENEIKCPPLIHPPMKNKKKFTEGFYILVSGIPHLKKIYRYAKEFNLKIYTNKILEGFKKAQRELPIIISNKNIKFVLARAGWNTIWLSNISKKPLICFDYEKGDYPEIFFNLKSIKNNNLGVKLNKNNIKGSIEEAKVIIPEILSFYKKINQKYNTLDGIKYSCKIIAEDFINKYLGD